jgi:hypothetical protein
MYEAGNSAKDYVSNAYTNYDCSSTPNELCILVLVDTTARDTDGNRFVLDPGQNDLGQYWFKVYDIGNNDQPPISKKEIKNDNDEIIGWEGCYDLDPGCWKEIQIHANFCRVAVDGAITACESTTSTGNKGNGIGLYLECCSS